MNRQLPVGISHGQKTLCGKGHDLLKGREEVEAGDELLKLSQLGLSGVHHPSLSN